MATVDCHDCQCIGCEFSLRGRAKEAERALEAASLSRFGTLYPKGPTPQLRSDNGLIERFFRSLQEERVWTTSFDSFEETKQAVEHWIRWYNDLSNRC